MEPDNAQIAVRATLLLLERIARRTRTQADDLLMGLLRANEKRLAAAVDALVQAGGAQPPTDEQVTQALEKVGIHV